MPFEKINISDIVKRKIENEEEFAKAYKELEDTYLLHEKLQPYRFTLTYEIEPW